MEKKFHYIPTAGHQAEIDSLKKLISSCEGPVAQMLVAQLTHLQQGHGIYVNYLAPLLAAPEAAAILNTSLEYVKRYRLELGETTGGDSIMALRFKRDTVFAFDKKLHQEALNAIRHSMYEEES